MRFKKSLELKQGPKYLDIIPILNVIFLLVIFFMLSSSFVLPSGINVNLPRSVTSDMVGNDSIQITVSRENVVYINDRAVTMSDIENLIKQISKRKKQSVLIKADKNASLGRAVEIWDLCRNSGIAQVAIATNQQ